MARRSLLRSLALVGCVVLALAGCSETTYNYAGNGNHFRVRGPVFNVDDDGTVRINQDKLTVLDSHGRAIDWFKNLEGQDFLSDEFNFESYYNRQVGGMWDSECEYRVNVGRVYGTSGAPLSLSSLKPGTKIEIEGSIRDSRYHSKSCKSEERAVYDTVRVVG